jgi:hypothetical protein
MIEILLYIKKEQIHGFIIAVKTHDIINIVQFIIEDNALILLGKLKSYFDIYHEFEIPNNLNPHLRRKWYVAEQIDYFVYDFISG